MSHSNTQIKESVIREQLCDYATRLFDHASDDQWEPRTLLLAKRETPVENDTMSDAQTVATVPDRAMPSAHNCGNCLYYDEPSDGEHCGTCISQVPWKRVPKNNWRPSTPAATMPAWVWVEPGSNESEARVWAHDGDGFTKYIRHDLADAGLRDKIDKAMQYLQSRADATISANVEVAYKDCLATIHAAIAGEGTR